MPVRALERVHPGGRPRRFRVQRLEAEEEPVRRGRAPVGGRVQAHVRIELLTEQHRRREAVSEAEARSDLLLELPRVRLIKREARQNGLRSRQRPLCGWEASSEAVQLSIVERITLLSCPEEETAS